MVNDIVKSLQGDIEKAIEAFRRELGKVRTGRANLSILDGVRVDYYGTPTPLNQIAGIGELGPLPGFDAGLHGLRVVAAIIESAQSGGTAVKVA